MKRCSEALSNLTHPCLYCLVFKARDVMSFEHADAASRALIAVNRQQPWLNGEGNQFALSKLGFSFSLQCFDTVGWVTGRASGL